MDYGDYMPNFLLIYIYIYWLWILLSTDIFTDKFPDEIKDENNNRVYNWVISLKNKNLNNPMGLYSNFAIGLRYVDILDIYNR